MGDRLATIDMGQKLGKVGEEGLFPFWEGGAGPHVIQCGLGWGLPLYQVHNTGTTYFQHWPWSKTCSYNVWNSLQTQ